MIKSRKKIIRILLILFISFTMVWGTTSEKAFAGASDCLYLREGRKHNFNYHIFYTGNQYSEWETVYIEYDPVTLKPIRIYQSRSVAHVYVHECMCGESEIEYRMADPEIRVIP